MRDYYNLYAKRSITELKQMRSRKYLRMVQVAALPGFFNMQEELALRDQIKAIDAELDRRAAQQPLF